MTHSDKEIFIRSLVDRVRDDMITKLSNIPEEWNGIELRTWIADRFKQEDCRNQMSSTQRRAYRNDILTRNLT